MPENGMPGPGAGMQPPTGRFEESGETAAEGSEGSSENVAEGSEGSSENGMEDAEGFSENGIKGVRGVMENNAEISGESAVQFRGGGMNPMAWEQSQKDDDAVVDTRITLDEVDTDTWIRMGLSLAVLCFGIFTACIYKRRR